MMTRWLLWVSNRYFGKPCKQELIAKGFPAKVSNYKELQTTQTTKTKVAEIPKVLVTNKRT